MTTQILWLFVISPEGEVYAARRPSTRRPPPLTARQGWKQTIGAPESAFVRCGTTRLTVSGICLPSDPAAQERLPRPCL